MKIVLIHPPHLNSTDDRLDPPLGLLYIATHLKKHNFDVEIADLSGKEIWNIPYADYYGITVYISSVQTTKQIIKKCKKINPKCKTIVGGAYPTACPLNFPYVDHVVIGYGEISLIDIITGKENEHIVFGKEPDDQFVFPAYDLIEPKSYHRKIGGETSLPYLTSRGCSYHCSFCGLEQIHKMLGYSVKMSNSGIVASQLKKIKDEFGINSINFQDDIFTLNSKRLFKILDAIKLLNIKFRCMGRAGYDTEETYKKLADAGCTQISWGIESGSQYILDRMKKNVKVQDNYNVIRWAKKNKINCRAFFVIGFPGETKETLEETKQFIIDANPDQIFVSNLIPYPGTEVRNNLKKYGIINISNNYKHYYQVSKDGTGGCVIDTEWLSKKQFKELEIEFRNWIKTRPMKGPLQDYEIKTREKNED